MTPTQDNPFSLKRWLAYLLRGLRRRAQRQPTSESDELSRGIFQIGRGGLALEVSAALRPAAPVSSTSVIAQVRFYDQMGGALHAASPQLRYSERVGSYFYPYDYIHGGVFRYVIIPPDGAAKAEVVLRHWRKLDTTPYSASAVSIRPADPVASPRGGGATQGGGKGWSAERALRGAIRSYATTLTADAAPLPAYEAPFGEAVVEHFIFETSDVELAEGLALRRLAAGRDRDALSLLNLVSDPRLTEAASRRALLRWAETLSPPVIRPGLGKAGAIVLIAQDVTSRIQDSVLNVVPQQDWFFEVFAPASLDGILASAVCTTIEALDPADAGQPARLADQVVRSGRGRDLSLIWAANARDALVAASVGRRLGVPVVYELLDSADWADRLGDAIWRNTDEGQREEALLRVALRAADRLIIHADADRAWLSMLTEDASRIFLGSSGAEVLGAFTSSAAGDVVGGAASA